MLVIFCIDQHYVWMYQGEVFGVLWWENFSNLLEFFEKKFRTPLEKFLGMSSSLECTSLLKIFTFWWSPNITYKIYSETREIFTLWVWMLAGIIIIFLFWQPDVFNLLHSTRNTSIEFLVANKRRTWEIQKISVREKCKCKMH